MLYMEIIYVYWNDGNGDLFGAVVGKITLNELVFQIRWKKQNFLAAFRLFYEKKRRYLIG